VTAPRAAGVVLALCLGLGLGGCRSVLPPTPIGPLDPTAERAQALLRGLAEAAAERRALRGTLRLSLDGPTGSLRSTQALVAQEPSQLRVEVQGFLSQTVAVLVTDGERFDLLRTTERVVQRGRVYPGLLFEVARIDLTPEEAVEVLLGAPHVPEGLVPASGRVLRDGGAQLDLADPGGAVLRTLEWDASGLLRAIESRSAAGEVLWQAEFEDFRAVEGERFAHRVALHFPVSKTEVRLEFEEVELNPDLSREVFVLRFPGAVGSGRRGGGA